MAKRYFVDVQDLSPAQASGLCEDLNGWAFMANPTVDGKHIDLILNEGQTLDKLAAAVPMLKNRKAVSSD